jgi:hypothetical protein
VYRKGNTHHAGINLRERSTVSSCHVGTFSISDDGAGDW